MISEKRKKYKRQWYLETRNDPLKKARRAANQRKWLASHPDYPVSYQRKNEAKIKAYRRKTSVKLRANKWTKERLKNPIYKLIHSIRVRVRQGLKGQRKTLPCVELLGCDLQFLKTYLELKFDDNMTWGNYGRSGWHIDHIKPCASFDLSNPEQQKICFHYTNLQPLWGIENMKKGKKIL